VLKIGVILYEFTKSPEKPWKSLV